MTDSAATGGAPTTQNNSYAREIRFGVVMYGGVSLAIYINGASNELYEMACATPKGRDTPGGGRTREVYRKASWLLRDQNLRDRYLAYIRGQKLPVNARNPALTDPFGADATFTSTERTRFVIDAIAGTSAGGINGLFLAKALVNGQDFSPLKKLWIQEGDIGGLLNDSQSYQGLEFAKTDDPPQSLLNSDRMYVKLVGAFQGMANVIPQVGRGEPALVDELDLFITTTDIRGAIVPLRLFDKVVYEKRYKQVYRFRHPSADGTNHFDDSSVPFLAFAARCTSSFPFAFEPMSVADAQRLCDANPTGGQVDFDRWKSFFTGLSSDDIASGRWRTRAFGDGGYLDNKPFSYVVETLSLRLGGLPMERKLIYLEPAPTNPELERAVFDRKPDALENALGALFTIPQDETIREDLEAILARNRRIERVERIVRQVETEIEERRDDPYARIELEGENHDQVPAWESRDLRDMANYYGTAFLPYRQLRVMTVTDDIAEQLAVWWNIDSKSDRLYAMKAMARVWRDAHYYENKKESRGRRESVNAFLQSYDVKYYVRRGSFILRKVHQLLSLVRKLGLPGGPPKLTDIEQHLYDLWEHHPKTRESMDFGRLVDALTCLAHGLGAAIGEIRRVTPLRAPSENADARKTHHDELEAVLHLLLGEGAVTALASHAGGTVPVSNDLPTPSPLLTLQENVFARATTLYQYAAQANLTGLQKGLQDDIELIRRAYASAIDGSSGGVPSAHDLLGKPSLRATPIEGGHRVDVYVEDLAAGGDALNGVEGKALRAFLADYYMRFDEYDQVSFPLYYDTGTGEPSTVEVVRVSPEDACSLIDEHNEQGTVVHQRLKLAGTALFHFGGFLDAQWRRNDIMWGRLDGCERLLTTLFPAKEDKEIRDALLLEAQLMIVREEMKPEGYAELVDRFGQALAEQKNATLEGAFDDLWGQLALTAGGQRRTQIAQALRAVLGDEGMLNYVREHYEVDRQLDRQVALQTSTRALTITGRILEELEQRRRGQRSWMLWVTRAGRATQVLLAIATPGSFGQIFFRYWLGLLYIFELVIIGGATLLGATGTRNFGWTAFAITLLIHLASLVTGDYVGRRRSWIKPIAIALLLMAIVLIFLGAMVLANGGLHGINCPGGHNAFGGVFDMLCQPGNSVDPHAPRPGG
ncbi:patatin-like protein [uncultured Bradyrhizobium sp.]|jgi:patatin-related protein|uniref:patatin-like protein n=1 Tax=uncultured Bradyrhizobium sp. TaxID=199684 RepID=UPI002606BD01|nr:patatin-like protein [uncultured Bradyrhizobium sp.]